MKTYKPVCEILFSDKPGNAHVSQIVSGYKMLENNGMLKIKSALPCSDFRLDGNYEHNSIVEVKIADKILAYDMADGYQSIHRKDVFDRQLDRVDFYFKRSLDRSFHYEMKNYNKMQPLSLNYLCTSNNNPYDKFRKKQVSVSELIRFIHNFRAKKSNRFYYTQFESNNLKYDSYNLIFLARLWDSSNTSIENILKVYPYFTYEEAKIETEKWKYTLDSATQNRIKYMKELKKQFGNRAIVGVQSSELAKKLCPELINDIGNNRFDFLDMIKKNYICITSEGLHHSIGWKFAEYIAAGKAVVTEPLFYEVPYGFEEYKNYLVYNDTDSLISNCDKLINNVELVHNIEENNRLYYRQHLRPDMLVSDSLRIAGIF